MMYTTTHIDHHGRVTLPVKLRQAIGIKVDQEVEIGTDGDGIFIKNIAPKCAICGKSNPEYLFKDRYLCEECVVEMKRL